MLHVPHHDLTVGIAMTALFCAGSGLISPAKAQLFGSSYTSTASKSRTWFGANLAAIMLSEAAAAADRGWGRLERKNFA